MSVQTNRDSDKIIIRLPDGMRDRIKRVAEQNNRSMNAEIVATLKETYPAPMPVDVLASTMTEWLDYIEAAPNREQKLDRIAGINRDLAFHDNLRALKVELREEDSELGITESVYITRREGGAPRPSPKGLQLPDHLNRSKGHTTAAEPQTGEPAPKPRQLKRPTEK